MPSSQSIDQDLQVFGKSPPGTYPVIMKDVYMLPSGGQFPCAEGCLHVAFWQIK
jgi:hypothetical protein